MRYGKGNAFRRRERVTGKGYGGGKGWEEGIGRVNAMQKSDMVKIGRKESVG